MSRRRDLSFGAPIPYHPRLCIFAPWGGRGNSSHSFADPPTKPLLVVSFSPIPQRTIVEAIFYFLFGSMPSSRQLRRPSLGMQNGRRARGSRSSFQVCALGLVVSTLESNSSFRVLRFVASAVVPASAIILMRCHHRQQVRLGPFSTDRCDMSLPLLLQHEPTSK